MYLQLYIIFVPLPSSLMEEHRDDIGKLESQIERLKRELADGQKERDILAEEVEHQKEANSRAPTNTMKKLVERLRNEVALKEKQQQVN